ncbi:substrate-binding domain-containing protein [Pantoea sp. A4]|uniref:substrate-binding domain-containing protein n=1 Tax=Pantoea sp. A4 TaxID=1225184 RepID=UPI000371F85E|nr:substrate-binding domain-containing protein [Pantoea sp. A4]
MNRKPTMKELVAATQLSRATIDRVLNNRAGVNPRTVEMVQNAYASLLVQVADEVKPTPIKVDAHFAVVVQASEEYNDAVQAAGEQLTSQLQAQGINLDISSCSDVNDAEVVRLINQQAERADGLAIVAKNTPEINAAVHKLKQQGKAIIALVSDLDADVREAYVGINNRAAGQAAGFILGRHLQFCTEARVAVIVGTLSYSCHDDREIGFRAQIRKTFPAVHVLEAISGNDNTQQTYAATKEILRHHPDLQAIYNVAGGNEGLSQALDEHAAAIRPIVITHEVNKVTENLLLSEKIDYVISQDIPQLLTETVNKLMALKQQQPVTAHAYLPIEILTRFTLPTSA